MVVEEAGTYVLVFDNSFSKLTSKRVTFYVDVKADDAEVDSKPDLTGWMLKKKKQKGIKRGTHSSENYFRQLVKTGFGSGRQRR